MGISVGLRLGLVANNNVPVGSGGIERLLEKLTDKRRAQTKDKSLILLRSLATQRHDSVWAHSQVIATNKVKLCLLNQFPDIRTLEVCQIVLVGGAQLCAHRAVVTGNDHTATTGGFRLIDTVLDAETSLGSRLAQRLGIGIVADAAKVDDGIRREKVAGSASSVLGAAASNQRRRVIVEQIIIDREMLLLGEDCIVGLEGVLVQKCLISFGRDVWRYVSIQPKADNSAI